MTEECPGCGEQIELDEAGNLVDHPLGPGRCIGSGENPDDLHESLQRW